jgi:hypothetical protein
MMISGLCACGFGETTPVASKNMYRKGKLIVRKGEHYTYVAGHRKSTPVPPELRIEDKIQRDPETGCWNWTGSINQGYGRIRTQGKTVNAYRLIYEMQKGTVPEGLELDHLCRNRACVNPDHLEPVTHAENMRRAGRRVLTGACHRGHEMTPENTYVSPKGRRNCNECRRINERRRAAK